MLPGNYKMYVYTSMFKFAMIINNSFSIFNFQDYTTYAWLRVTGKYKVEGQ